MVGNYFLAGAGVFLFAIVSRGVLCPCQSTVCCVQGEAVSPWMKIEGV
jgi:hypothetical protein